MQIPRPDEHERRRLRGHADRVASADRRPSLRLRQEPRHQEFVKGCQAALMGRTTFEPALTNDRWPWPNLNVSCSVPSARGAPDHVVSDHDPPRLLDKLRAADRGGDVDLVGGPVRSRPSAPSGRPTRSNWSCCRCCSEPGCG
jgi:hypothetical protein